MNRRQLGSCRDRRILDLVEACGALTAEQVACIVFRGDPFPLRQAQHRLRRLWQQKRLKRRPGPNGSYVYYLEAPKQLDHRLGINWARAWLTAGLQSWETLERWEYEQDYGVLRCDAFAGIRNRWTGEWRFLFVEVDRSANAFDKPERYSRLYGDEAYRGRWWVPLARRFPAIVCVTEDRQDAIRRAWEAHNPHGLRFEVRTLEDIREECIKCLG